jgi:hypothetical protein
MRRPAIGSSGERGRDRPSAVARPRHARVNLSGDIHDLGRLSRSELRQVWTQELGDKPPATLGRDILALAIAYGRQERRQGGLTKPVTRELDRLLEQALRDDRTDNPSAVLSPPLPRNGTVLVREWQGTTHHVTIVKDGFLWNGSTHRSLSGIAQAITGTKWNGPRFFGMREVNGKARESRRG